MSHTWGRGRKESVGIISDKVQRLEFLDKEFKSALINMCKEIRKTMSKGLKKWESYFLPNREYD